MKPGLRLEQWTWRIRSKNSVRVGERGACCSCFRPPWGCATSQEGHVLFSCLGQPPPACRTVALTSASARQVSIQAGFGRIVEDAWNMGDEPP